MNTAVSNSHRVVLTDAQLRRLDMPGPRYTSYPTADRFVEAFGPKEYRQALRQLQLARTVSAGGHVLSLIHI